VDFPIKNGGSFHSYVTVYQRVTIVYDKLSVLESNLTMVYNKLSMVFIVILAAKMARSRGIQ
jgi:hypothetical protein